MIMMEMMMAMLMVHEILEITFMIEEGAHLFAFFFIYIIYYLLFLNYYYFLARH
jgi:hypothetical protein